MATTQERLDAVNDAIHNIMLGGAIQSYSINGKTINKVTLDQLEKYRDKLMGELSQEGSSKTHYAAFQRPQ